MELLLRFCGVFAVFTLAQAFSKYGRTCKDIGCLSNEVCVMETDPCSYYQRQTDCGSYPTCKRQDSGPRTCTNYVCPPTKVCKMDGATPKCVDDHSKVGRVGYDESEVRSGNNGAVQPSGNLYPQVPRGETTPRPNVNYPQPVAPQGSGYQGGQIGSGYPGQARPAYPAQPSGGSAYPQQPAGYPQQPSGYPQEPAGYPQQPAGGRYPAQGGYPQQGAYPQGGYGQQPNYGNYPGGYNTQQGGYNPYNGYYGQGQQNNNNRYGQKSEASSGIFDSITAALKNYGTKLLKDTIKKQISGQ